MPDFSAADLSLERLFAELLDGLNPGGHTGRQDPAAGGLQSCRQPRPPKYATLGTTGAAHASSASKLPALERLGVRTVGTGSSRRLAEQAAAELALRHLEP